MKSNIETSVLISRKDGQYVMTVTASGPNGSRSNVFKFDEFPLLFDDYIETTIGDYYKMAQKQ